MIIVWSEPALQLADGPRRGSSQLMGARAEVQAGTLLMANTRVEPIKLARYASRRGFIHEHMPNDQTFERRLSHSFKNLFHTQCPSKRVLNDPPTAAIEAQSSDDAELIRRYAEAEAADDPVASRAARRRAWDSGEATDGYRRQSAGQGLV